MRGVCSYLTSRLHRDTQAGADTRDPPLCAVTQCGRGRGCRGHLQGPPPPPCPDESGRVDTPPWDSHFRLPLVTSLWPPPCGHGCKFLQPWEQCLVRTDRAGRGAWGLRASHPCPETGPAWQCPQLSLHRGRGPHGGMWGAGGASQGMQPSLVLVLTVTALCLSASDAAVLHSTEPTPTGSPARDTPTMSAGRED